MSNKIKWLSVKDDLTKASDDELKASLLTPDGCGSEFKAKVLQEIINRIATRTYNAPAKQLGNA